MRVILKIQAVYYLLTGLWPLVSIRTFEAVTGPKIDDWLVHMVGLLAASIGATLFVGSAARQPVRETVVLSILSAASFAAIDIFYALNGTISRIYLADAAIQAIFLSVIFVSLFRRTGPAIAD
jgi:hypothetical protein